MSKYPLRLEARKLRSQGVSIKEISKILHVSKGSVSIWVRDIILTIGQLEKLRKSSIEGAERGRLKSALLQKERWLKGIEEEKKLGISHLSNLTDRELLIAGVALYWGEGSKKTRTVQFCNSDPKMIQFLIIWLKRCFLVEDDDITCAVGINIMHMSRDAIVKKCWSKISGIPLNKFRKTSFKKVENKKIYDNFNEHFGTLSVKVVKPARFYGKILGLIEGLFESGREKALLG